jgi:hypothetical protein
MRLSTHLRRSVFALPLLAVAVLGLGSLEAPVAPTLQAWEPAADDCAAPSRPVGARGLARMPGDLSPFNRRMRCAG